nr:hypothetical protein [Tanacetum cinerariifolium]
SHGDMGRLQEAVLSSVFPSSGAGALEGEVPPKRPTNSGTKQGVQAWLPRTCWFPGGAAGTGGEEAEKFPWEIPHERDDQDSERPDKRQRSGDRHQPNSQQSSHRSHGQNNDRHGSDRHGGNDNHRGSNNNNYSSSNN